MRRAAVLALVFATLSASAAVNSARADTNKASAARFHYAGYMGGVKVGYATMDVAVGDARYAAKLDMETGGLVGMLFDWRHGSSAYGAAEPNGQAPFTGASYVNVSEWQGEDRIVEVAYQDGVASVARANPDPIRDEGRAEVDANLRAGVLDPLSAIVALGRIIDRTGKCDADFGVFDGRRLYRFVVADEGLREIERNSYAPFGGEARRCAFEFRRVAGFKKKKKAKGPPTKGLVYFRAAKQGAPTMPVQMIAESKYGATILHLRTIDLIDPELAELAARKLGGGASD